MQYAPRDASAAGSAWTEDEEYALQVRFESGMPPAKIAEAHGRTIAAVLSRLVRMRRIWYLDGVYYKLEPWVTLDDLRN